MDEELADEYYNNGYTIITHGTPSYYNHTCSVYFGPAWRKEQKDNKGINLPKGLYSQNGKAEQIMKLIVQGAGTRSIIRDTHATGRTVRKYRDILQKLTSSQFNCPCGKPAAHHTHCEYKLSGGHKTLDNPQK